MTSMDMNAWQQKHNDLIQRQVEQYNATPGNLNKDHTDVNGKLIPGDGIDCPLCRNRGNTYVMLVDGTGDAQMYYKPCECLLRRSAVRRLRESGLEKAVKRCTFDAFKDNEPWQVRMKDTAMSYVREGAGEGKWLYVGGQSGSGKSMLCTAVAGELLKRCNLRYMVWPQEARRLKAMVNDAEGYAQEITALQTVEALYIDDFWKPAFRTDGGDALATAADVRLAFDILNARYINDRPTIISSEWFSSELAEIDEAIAGRIVESAGEYVLDIGRDASRNWRMKGNVI